jgi:hypothetical protein
MTLRVQIGSTLWAAFILGFALGGFFDGILLHQVLQWHQFFSLVGGRNVRDIRTQVLADGLFHVACILSRLPACGCYGVHARTLWLRPIDVFSEGCCSGLVSGSLQMSYSFIG